MLLLVIIIGTMLLISAACSLTEACLLSVSPAQIASIERKHPAVGAIWKGFRADIQRPIAVVLVINTIANTAGAMVAGARYDQEFPHAAGWHVTLFSISIAYLVLQFAEILPKTLGVRYNRSLAPVVALPLAALVRVLRPAISLVKLVNRPFEPRRAPGGAGGPRPATIDEISMLASIARTANLIGRQQEQIIRRAADLHDLSVEDIMIPLEQVTFLRTDQTPADAVLTAHLDPHTRFPVAEGGDRDRIAGYVNFKELVYHMRVNPRDLSLLGIVRPMVLLKRDHSVARALQEFVREHVHIAIVQDDSRRTLGLVTLEDMVEELVGEIEDEFDRLPRHCHRLPGGTWMLGGGHPVSGLAAQIGMPLTDAEGGSVSAWLIRRAGRLPTVNESMTFDGVGFTVRRVRRGKIFEIVVTAGPEAKT